MIITRFPDTVELVRVLLSTELAVDAASRLPSTWPAAGFLRVMRTGGTQGRLVDEALIDVEAWHRVESTAERLAREAVGVALAAAGTTVDGWAVLSVSNPGGVAALPHPRYPDMHRATAKIGLRVRGVTATTTR